MDGILRNTYDVVGSGVEFRSGLLHDTILDDRILRRSHQ